MGYRHNGQVIDRYADIFSGYFVQACAKHLGHAVRFGTPWPCTSATTTGC